jgi:hypothetical protein
LWYFPHHLRILIIVSHFLPFSLLLELIVMFNHYMAETEQRSVLNTILSEETGWEVLERNNPAKALPSDFALLKVLIVLKLSFFSQVLICLL